MSAHFPLTQSVRSYAGVRGRARVVVSHGRRLRVRLAEGVELLARPAQRGLQVVCGDWVQARHDERHHEWLLEAVEPRNSAFYRSNSRGDGELLAANLSLLLIVVAPLPRVDWFIADRYLAAARCERIGAAVLLNKCDLPLEAALRDELQTLQAAGYPVLQLSACKGSGLPALRAMLAGQCAMLVGQSGTGKSSLLRALLPDAEATVGELARDRTGRHTTTATRLYSLPQGYELLDSPGVRDFAPAIARLEPRALGFPEIEALASGCRFGDCQHLSEPACAVLTAVGDGRLSARRHESYRRLRRLYQRLRPDHRHRP